MYNVAFIPVRAGSKSINNKNIAFVTSPKLYKELTTAQVLVMEYIDGYSITDIHTLEKEGYDNFLAHIYVYAYDNDLFSLWDVARNHTLLLNTYINSRRFKTKLENSKEKEK